MVTISTEFSAEQHGFRFPNRFPFAFPTRYALPYAGEVALQDVLPGMAGGVCYTALDYFLAGQNVPRAARTEDLSERLLTYIAERHLDSLSLANVFQIIEWSMLDAGEIAARASRLEIPRLRRWLRRGTPAAIVIARRAGMNSSLQNTVAVALRMDITGGGRRVDIALYDPDHPGETLTLTMRRRRGAGRIAFSESSGEVAHGFFLLPYAPRDLPPELRTTLAEAVAFGARETLPFVLQWPVDSRRINQEFNVNPQFYRPFGLPGHEGLDLYANTGASVYAAADGDVIAAGAPKNHPYGLHVRITHRAGDTTYHTIYGHLSKIFVAAGQAVRAGQAIGLADNTGNSFGSHLHFTLKIDGETTPGFPPGIVDPLPFLSVSAILPMPVALPPDSGIRVFTLRDINLRAGAGTETDILTGLPSGETLSVLGDAATARGKIGVQDAWLQVLTANGTPGWVAAWFVQDAAQAFPPSDLVVYPDDSLNLRAGPGTAFAVVAKMEPTTALTVLGDGGIARQKLGKGGEWLQVQSAEGERGFVAAWFVHTTGEAAPASGLTVSVPVQLNIRARPSTEANILTVAVPGDSLAVLGERDAATARIGVEGQWLQVQTKDGFCGWAAAWLVSIAPGEHSAPPSPAAGGLTVYPIDGINVRAQPSVGSPRLFGALRGEALAVLETDLVAARKKVGQAEQWVFVENAQGQRGWAAAWFLGLERPG